MSDLRKAAEEAERRRRLAALIESGRAVLLVRSMGDLPADVVGGLDYDGDRVLWCGVPVVVADSAQRQVLEVSDAVAVVVDRKWGAPGFRLPEDSAGPSVRDVSRGLPIVR